MSTVLSPRAAVASPSAPPAADPREVVRRARRRPQRRTRLVVAFLSALLVTVFLVRITLGDFIVTLPDVVRIVTGTEIPGASYILMESKLPRAVLGVLVGAAFGVGGAIFQTTLRNPLASPDVVGVSVGASTTAVFTIVVLDQRGAWLAVAAVLGAVGVSVGVRLLVGAHAGTRLVLVGVALSAGLYSVVQYLFTRADEWDTQIVLQWLIGSLNRVDWPTIRVLSLLLLLVVPVLVVLARSARVSELGDDAAAGLGVPPRRADLLLLVAVLLVGLGVAAAGPVSFVAFLAGPIARALNGGRTTLVGAGLVGAIIVVAADHVAAYAVPDVNFPVGVVTGAVGAPFLLWLLATGRTSRRS
ncbi:iron complex transport system permease protein [Nocardioides scoriae]|uniref:Iron complex transport system permease protein n=1 Tax=Nocardioides scoriae TaxID=642780 RepID=A0A1H1WE96_9ACTN|nr:iron ABC transporter permease [Nocardioides scoriae]SDS95718.1 iron complex transport system permease protein [Nocardioides scoriae]